MAVVLSGTPITAMIAPLLGTWLIGNYGWRMGFVGVGLSWIVVSFPIVFFLFREGKGRAETDASAAPRDHSGLTLREGMRTRAFVGLLISFGAFSFYNMSMATNLVPLLGETGIPAMQAAGIASIMGLTGIFSRVLVGFLLDRFPGHIIGMICQSLPVIGCAILLLDAPSVLLLSVAVAFFGIATGAEMDAALYLATRHFGLKAFASLFGAIITFGAVNAAVGPYVAGWLHDSSGSYDLLLVVILVAMWLGAWVSRAISATGVTLPAYIGAMLVGAAIRNLDDRTHVIGLPVPTTDLIGNVCLSLFLAVALMNLKLWELAGLALPLLVNLALQAALVAAFCAVVFHAMGRDYDAAVMGGGFIGFMLGTTANAMAVMRTLVERYGAAPRAFLVAPLVGAFFIDFSNALIITGFLNFWD